MKVTVKLFAVAKERAGCDAVEVDLTDSATVRQLRVALAGQHPSLASIVPHARFAIDNEYSGDQIAVPAAAEIALIPPVSGG